MTLGSIPAPAALANEPVATRSGPNSNVVCHAPGEKCLGCDHYYGKADKCEYAPNEPVAHDHKCKADGEICQGHATDPRVRLSARDIEDYRGHADRVPLGTNAVCDQALAALDIPALQADLSAARLELAEAKKDAERFEWCLPILTAQGILGDARALVLAAQLAKGLDGTAAIDAAIDAAKERT